MSDGERGEKRKLEEELPYRPRSATPPPARSESPPANPQSHSRSRSPDVSHRRFSSSRRSSPPRSRHRRASPGRGRGYSDEEDADRHYRRLPDRRGPRGDGWGMQRPPPQANWPGYWGHQQYGREQRPPPRCVTPPLDLPHGMLSYRSYASMQHPHVAPSELKRNYESYRRRFTDLSQKAFFDKHKDEEWFQEKYHPTISHQHHLERAKVIREQSEQFMNEFAEVKDLSIYSLDDDGSQKPEPEKAKSNVVFVRGLHSSAKRAEIESALLLEGRPAPTIILAEAQTRRTNLRLCWALYETEEDAVNALVMMPSLNIANSRLVGQINHMDTTGRVAPPAASLPGLVRSHWHTAGRLIEAFDQRVGVEGHSLLEKTGGLWDDGKRIDDSETVEEKQNQRRIWLDVRIAYLRKVHNMCFYCGEENPEKFSLNQRCGPWHRRAVKGDVPIDKIPPMTSWVATLEDRLRARLEMAKTAGKKKEVEDDDTRLDRLVDEASLKYMDELDPEKWRCLICKKLFRSKQFLSKHLGNKHPDEIDELKANALSQADSVTYFEAYLSDPRRPQETPVDDHPHPPPRPSYTSPPPPRDEPHHYQQRAPAHHGGRKDPRSLRSYVDLDTPAETAAVADYDAPLPFDDDDDEVEEEEVERDKRRVSWSPSPTAD